MNLETEQIPQLQRDRGRKDAANETEGQLPHLVDVKQHADLLRRFGLDPEELELLGESPGAWRADLTVVPASPGRRTGRRRLNVRMYRAAVSPERGDEH